MQEFGNRANEGDGRILKDVSHLITLSAAAKSIGVPEEELHDLSVQGFAPHWRFGAKNIRFDRDELKAWANRNLISHHKGCSTPKTVVALEYIKKADEIWEFCPREIRTIDGLLDMSFVINPPSGIYFLCKSNRVVYVGQSTNICSRIIQHMVSKKFDRVFMLPCPRRSLNSIEAFFINRIKPELNKGSPSSDREYLVSDDVMFTDDKRELALVTMSHCRPEHVEEAIKTYTKSECLEDEVKARLPLSRLRRSARRARQAEADTILQAAE
jgi:hypothetical protein